jgi:hypothetical protein
MRLTRYDAENRPEDRPLQRDFESAESSRSVRSFFGGGKRCYSLGNDREGEPASTRTRGTNTRCKCCYCWKGRIRGKGGNKFTAKQAKSRERERRETGKAVESWHRRIRASSPVWRESGWPQLTAWFEMTRPRVQGRRYGVLRDCDVLWLVLPIALYVWRRKRC